MEILNNITWYIEQDPKTATEKQNSQKLSKSNMNTIVFGDTDTKNPVKIAFPLNDNYKFFVIKEIARPATVGQILTFIYKFYKEPLDHAYMDEAFEEMEEWKEEIIDFYEGDLTKLKNYDVFTDTCSPDFCGLEFNEETEDYIVHIGPE
jgi:hypothetical protein